MSQLIENRNDAENYQNLKMKKSLGILGRLITGFSLVTIFFLVAIGINWVAITMTKNYANQVSKVELPTYDELLDLTHICKPG